MRKKSMMKKSMKTTKLRMPKTIMRTKIMRKIVKNSPRWNWRIRKNSNQNKCKRKQIVSLRSHNKIAMFP